MNGTTVVRRSVGATATTGGGSGGAGGGGSVQELPPVATLVVYKDDAGYGMKVSGDNPVYVQSVKDGGAAARAGLHAGDTIIKVNGVNVTSSTHTEVVQLIKSSTQVVLTVQQKTGIQLGTQNQSQRPTSLTTAGSMVSSTSPQSSTSLHRAATAPAGTAPTTTARITGPQPVDLEKKRQLETQRVHTFQLMLEKEQSYVDKLRSELAKAGTSSGNASNITTLQSELHGAERRVRTLQEQLAAITTNDQLCSLVTNVPVSPGNYSSSVGGGVGVIGDIPPPLPSRKTTQSMMNNSPPPLPPRPPQSVSNTHNIAQLEPERNLMFHLTPPSHGIPNSVSSVIAKTKKT